jgi:hypothetical protein
MNRYGHHPARRSQSPRPAQPPARPPDGAVTTWDRRALAPVARVEVALVAVPCVDCQRLMPAGDAAMNPRTGEWHCRSGQDCAAALASMAKGEVGR